MNKAPKMRSMTPKEVADEFTENGEVNIPADVRIVMPKKGSALSAMVNAQKKKAVTKNINQMEIKDG